MHQLDFNIWWPMLTIILSNEKRKIAIECLNLNANERNDFNLETLDGLDI
jgi:hypothetical protein